MATLQEQVNPEPPKQVTLLFLTRGRDEKIALSEFETVNAEKAVSAFIEKRRPPPSIRKELDLGYRIKGQSIELFEIRPVRQSTGMSPVQRLVPSRIIKYCGSR